MFSVICAAGLTLGQSLKRLSVELSSTLRIRIFRQHLGMYLGGYIAQDVFNAVFTYYVVFVLMQSPTVASNLMGTMAILQFLAVIGMIPLCIRFGPAPSYRLVVCLFGLPAVSYGVLYYSGLHDTFSLLLLISALAGLGRSGINYVPWNTYTYIADVDKVITAQRRDHDADSQGFSGWRGDAGGRSVTTVGVCFRAERTGTGREPYHPHGAQCRYSLRAGIGFSDLITV